MQTYGTATYSPDDNKLRLYPVSLLDAETRERVKDAGFKWAPKQKLYVAPMWSPRREDLLIELCGEIGDEDTSLLDRAEDRAERFEDYSDKRADDAESARRAVAAIADNIPFGQPILVGHHSDKRARKDAERIENGMRKAVKMWQTSEYWKTRAAGAIRHAKYKERPDVRSRRIKGLEADKRKQERYAADAEKFLKLWRSPNLTIELARKIANYDHVYVAKDERGALHWSAWDVLQSDEERYKACPAMPLEQVREIVTHAHERTIAHCNRWLAHIENRLAYERAMLADAGGTVADRNAPQKGGGVKCWASPRGGWSYVQKVNKVSVTVLDNWGNGGGNFTRTIPFDKLSGSMSAAEVQEAREAGRLVESSDKVGFFLRVKPADEVKEETADERKDRQHREYMAAKEPEAPQSATLRAMQEQLKLGVQVIPVAQLFTTGRELAARMVEKADIKPGHRVLEPSAGTGAILAAMPNVRPSGSVVAVEINKQLADNLKGRVDEIWSADFLTLHGLLGTFDRILMNPPFANAADVKHIEHARTMLAPDGRLVAICANGPRQIEKLKPLCSEWHELPEGTFKDAGTNVRTALIVIEAHHSKDRGIKPT